MRVIVTGAAGFIGSNIVFGLNKLGIDDILLVDDLSDGQKYRNLVGAQFSDYIDRREFYSQFLDGRFGRIDVVMHEGACSDTMQQNGRLMMEDNYEDSKKLLKGCLAGGTRLLYASSAATYGTSDTFREDSGSERPLNVYGWSKYLFDNFVKQRLRDAPCQIAGFRYFNVYGPREHHKGRMASVAFHHFQQYKKSGQVALFGSYGGYGPGLQERDFVSVEDVVAVKLWFLENANAKGVFNLGTGRAQPFNDVACAVINSVRITQGSGALAFNELTEAKAITYTPFPKDLEGKYQCHTQADMEKLRNVGCQHSFLDVNSGVKRYIDWLTQYDKDWPEK